jgi:hypothetical protein
MPTYADVSKRQHMRDGHMREHMRDQLRSVNALGYVGDGRRATGI